MTENQTSHMHSDFTESETPSSPLADRDPSHEHPSQADDQEKEVNPFELLAVLLSRWRITIGLPLAAATITAVISLVIPTRYESTTTFVPEGDPDDLRVPGALAGLASQFGLGIPRAGGTSPDFYADLILSRTILEQVLTTSLPNPYYGDADSLSTLLAILDKGGDTNAEQLEEGRRHLRKRVSVSVGTRTDMVTLSVETPYPTLSADVANLFVTLVDRFNTETRQSNARTLTNFIGQQVTEAETGLTEAEDQLRLFLERNRQFESSPDLQFQYERHQRQVRIKEEVYTSLRRQLEEARIQEVNDTPLITVVDPAVPPQRKSFPQRKLLVILAILTSGAIAVGVAFAAEYVAHAKAIQDNGILELTHAWNRLAAEARSALTRRPPPQA